MKKSRINRFTSGIVSRKRWLQSVLCIVAGVILFLAAEVVDVSENSVENGILFRNACGKGDAVYTFYVDGLDGESEVVVSVPEQKMTEKEFAQRIPEIMDVLCERILGENESLMNVRSDLVLVKEIPEFGVSVQWHSEKPEVVNNLGSVEGAEAAGTQVYLQANLRHGQMEETVEIPIVVYPIEETQGARFLTLLDQVVHQDPECREIILPKEFEGRSLSYRAPVSSSNKIFLLLGIVASVCLLLKDKSDMEAKRKFRENRLMEDYPDFVVEFLILINAGYSAKAAWKKLNSDYQRKKKKEFHPLYEEVLIAVNQMEAGIPETRVYAEFGRRCGLRCYLKFVSLLEGSIYTGGKSLRKLLEAEIEEALKQRTDLARRKGEEISSKLLFPMFCMLGTVMVMVVAPAFLSFG